MTKKDGASAKAKRVAVGGALAAAAGYVAGLLTAPKSGKETRTDIKKATVKTQNEIEKDFKKVQGDVDKVIKEAKAKSLQANAKTKKEINDLVKTAKDTRDKAKELVTTVQTGEATDKDLKKAVRDVKTAAKHLRDYLTK